MNLARLLVFSSITFVLPLVAQEPVRPPYVVAVPPSDGGRGLVRAGAREIRHYSGDKKPLHYLVSFDNGLTWADREESSEYPPNFGGIPQEAPAFACSPVSDEFIRIQPVGDYVFATRGGLGGYWASVTREGRWVSQWLRYRSEMVSLDEILRNPLFLANTQRLLVPAHDMRKGTYVHISDNAGRTWHKSVEMISVPPYQPTREHQGVRWYNAGVEGSIVELKGGKLWMLLRTSQDQHYQSFSTDKGETWSQPGPSRFYGTLTMPTIGRLKDGRILVLWTNAHPLPELKTAVNDMWEDVFTNRDSHHVAISSDNGRTWRGFREMVLDEHRNRGDYATMGEPGDRGKQQSEFLQLDDNRVLVSLGQHKEHRRMMIFDTRWLEEKSRANNFANGLDDWTCHTFIPVVKGHASYNRKPAAFLLDHPDKRGAKVMKIAFWNDPELVNAGTGADYRRGGATWNFPNAVKGRVDLRFMLPEGSGGVRISLMDQLFNACDRDVAPYALYTLTVKPGEVIGSEEPLRAGSWYRLSIRWNGVGEGAGAELLLNDVPAGTLPLNRESPNGASYLHLISIANEADTGMLVESVQACAE